MRSVFAIILMAAIFLITTFAFGGGRVDAVLGYRWKTETVVDRLNGRISPPPGFRRVWVGKQSFGNWLRHMPLKPEGSGVHLFNGKLKDLQDVHAAVFDIDVGTKDRQQCADAVMRLRAEYLYSVGKAQSVCFAAAKGNMCYRDYQNMGFRRYLSNVFAFANSRTLYHMLKKAGNEDGVYPGDVFIEPAGKGAYGHAVIVMDVAENEDGEKMFLLAQSYMPAQEIHLLKNPTEPELGPWYRYVPESTLYTPQWTFSPGSQRRF